MRIFLLGAIFMGFCVGGLFFFRFWQKTKDVFFLIFSVAFWLLASEKIPLAVVDPLHEGRHFIYLIRLTAFLLILFAIWHKNRPSKPGQN